MFNIFKLFWSYNLPRWSILIIDTVICAFSLTLAVFLRFNFDDIPEVDKANLPLDYAVLLGIRFISFFISKTYKGVVRYTSTRDAARIFFIVLLGSFLVFVINVIYYYVGNKTYFFPNSIIIIDALCTLFLMISSRLAVKAIYLESKNPTSQRVNVIIFGAGEAGIITKRTLDRDAAIKYKVIAFVDDDEKKRGRSLEGAFIHTTGKF